MTDDDGDDEDDDTFSKFSDFFLVNTPTVKRDSSYVRDYTVISMLILCTFILNTHPIHTHTHTSAYIRRQFVSKVQ